MATGLIGFSITTFKGLVDDIKLFSKGLNLIDLGLSHELFPRENGKV